MRITFGELLVVLFAREMAVAAGAFLLVVWVATNALFSFLQESLIP
jgi:hypothetical protein